MLTGKRILIAEDNEWLAAELMAAVAHHHSIPLSPARTNADAFTLIEEQPDGAILDGNLLDGPATPVACILSDRSIPLIVFSGLGLPHDLQKSHPEILVLLKPQPSEVVIRAIAASICRPAQGGSNT